MTNGPSNSQRKRIERLEALTQSHSVLIAKSGSRPLSKTSHRDERLAITVDVMEQGQSTPQGEPAGQVSIYPSPSGSGVPKFPIKFIDASYAQSAGWEELRTLQRGSESVTHDQIAASVNGAWVPPGTVVKAMWQRPPKVLAVGDKPGEWFIEPYVAKHFKAKVHKLPHHVPLHDYSVHICELMIFDIATENWVNVKEDGQNKEIGVWDRNRDCCVLLGEMHDVHYVGEKDGEEKWHWIGEAGLTREVKVTADVQAGGTGNGFFVFHGTAGSCPGEVIIEPCTFCNKGDSLKAGDRIIVHWLENVWVRTGGGGGKIYLGKLAAPLCAVCDEYENQVLVDVVNDCGDGLPQQITAINWPNTAGFTGARCEFFKCGDLYYLINVMGVPRNIAVEDAECGGSGRFIKDEECVIRGHTIPGVPINTCEQPSWKTQIQFSQVEVLDDIYDYSNDNSCNLVFRKSYKTFCVLNPQVGGTGLITIEMDTVPVVETITLEQEQDGCDLLLKGTASQICVRKFTNAAPAEFGRVAFQEFDATNFTTYELDGCVITILQEFVNFCALPSPIMPRGDDEQTITFETTDVISDIELPLTTQESGSGSGGATCEGEIKLNYKTTKAMRCGEPETSEWQNASIITLHSERVIVAIDWEGCPGSLDKSILVLHSCDDGEVSLADCGPFVCPDGSGSGGCEGSAYWQFNGGTWNLIDACPAGCTSLDNPNEMTFEPPPSDGSNFISNCVPE